MASPLSKAGVEEEIVEFAPAKINLYLHVLGKRDDGYHLLDSLIAFADIGDYVRVEPDAQLSLRLEGPFAQSLSVGADNLVLRAAQSLRIFLNNEQGARITLTKNLPVASGIGGGSANAAATLRALLNLWNIKDRISANDLAALSLKLGADVPVCLWRRTSYFGGVGEIIDPAPPLPEIYLLLANPLIATPTPQIFTNRRGPYSSKARLAEWPSDARQFTKMLSDRHNDLECPAQEIVPIIKDVLKMIETTDHCLLARMSGSGATCFGLYEKQEEAIAAAETLKKARPSWWVENGRLAP